MTQTIDKSSSLPKNWKVTKLGEIAVFLNGYAFAPENWKEDGLPIIRIEQLRDENASADFYDKPLPERFGIRNGDLIFSWSASLLTRIWDRGEAYLNQHLFKVENRLNVNRAYLKHLLDFNIDAMASETHGSTMKHITRPALLNYPVEIPIYFAEQRAIADILTTVDDAIEQTEALIHKYQRIKQGLMQDLLTRGVDENGEIRGQNNHRFKNSEIGPIPYEWEVTDFEHLVNNITARWIPRNTGVTFPCLNLENIESETGQVNGLSDAIENASTKTIFLKGDILFGKLRPYLKKYWIADVDGVCTTEILVFRAQRPIDHKYIYYLVQNEKFINYTISSSFGTKMPRTSWEIIKRYKIGKPDFEEQKRISKILSTIDSQIETSRVELSKLNSLKKGLMQDLLTGKVRVNYE